MTTTHNNLVPFIATRQYKKFRETCNFVRERRKIGLVYGEPGAGKSYAARRYVAEQPPLAINGLSPTFYIELEQTDKTDRAFYNALVASILHQAPENVTAKVAGTEAKRLLEKYRYEMLIIDEFQFLQDSGLEAVRTLWDKTGISIVLITMTQFRSVLQKTKHLQLYSRIIRFLTFDRLTKEQIARDLLPNVEVHTHIHFDRDQSDADEVVRTLYEATQGNFREIAKILDQANELIDLSKQMVAHYGAGGSKRTAPEVRRFDADIIREAAAMTKDLDLP